MLDVRLFRNMRFSAASGAVTVSFFTLFGFIFLITQYFQFVRGYGPLSTGVRLLPVALSVGAGSVAGTALAVRAGTKLIVTTGLVATAGFYGWVAATTSAATSYGIIAVQMVVYGLGMGLTSAPATESIMGAISRAKAGVGSAVNDSTRLIGGTLGVAVIGSVYASVYGSRLTATLPARTPGPVAAIAHQSVGAAYTAAGQLAALGHPALGLALQHASANAFLRGLTIGALVAGGVAAAGAILAILFCSPSLPSPPGSCRNGARIRNAGRMKTYSQYCAVARSLDLIGDRWVLLIVRELLSQGPCRFTDLRDGLPGIATNLLAARLKEMEESGLITRVDAPPPVATGLYQLTERGQQLQPVIAALVEWGLPTMPVVTEGEAERGTWLGLLGRLRLRDTQPAQGPLTIAIDTPEAPVHLVSSGHEFEIRRGRPAAADVRLSGQARLIGGYLGGLLSLAEARRLGLDATGDEAALNRLEITAPQETNQ